MLTYYIDYYDMNDGWLGFDYVSECRKEWIFGDWDVANGVKDGLNGKMDFGNVRCGEYYEVRQVPVGFLEYCKECDDGYTNP